MLKNFLSTSILLLIFFQLSAQQKIFDVHVHGSADIKTHIEDLQKAGVYKAAVSSSWALQDSFRTFNKIPILYGIMLPCPEGKVPYSRQLCFENGMSLPDVNWVEQQIISKKIDFIGEMLSQYYGVSPSDSILFPYYALAEKYGIPVGIHTGLAGPGHGSPDFKIEFGKPLLLERLLISFPKLRVWIMHGGSPFIQETIAIMSVYRNVYADISVMSNPYIIPASQFHSELKALIDAGLEDRLMFGSDNGQIRKTIEAVNAVPFLNIEQKEKIFYKNAEVFFRNKN